MTIPFPGAGAGGSRRLPPVDRTVVIVVAVGAVLLALNIRNGRISIGSLVFFAVLVPSIILHEVSHGAVALAFGDDTAQRAGRLSLNPLRHIDPIGTVILPAVMVLAGGPAFGYAKPVPVNPRRMRKPRDHGLLTSLAGPATNIALALLGTVLIVAVGVRGRVIGGQLFTGSLSFTDELLIRFGLANVFLAVFNLIPLPPLDGSAVIERFLPAAWWPRWLQLRQYSFLLLFGLIFLLPDFLGAVFGPAADLWLRLTF